MPKGLSVGLYLGRIVENYLNIIFVRKGQEARSGVAESRG
jgi:hypothetical protein